MELSTTGYNPLEDLKRLLRFNDHVITVIVVDNKPWFNGSDVCKILGYKKSRDIIEHNITVKENITDYRTLIEILNRQNHRHSNNAERIKIYGNSGAGKYINESGILQLVDTCRKPEAEPFKKWVYNIAIPEALNRLREAVEVPTIPLMIQSKEEVERLQKLVEQIQKEKDELQKALEVANEEKIKEHQKMVEISKLYAQAKAIGIDGRIYIATRRSDAKLYLFKVGMVGSGGDNALKERLSGYNTNCPDDDPYYYCNIWKCNAPHEVEMWMKKHMENYRQKPEKEIYRFDYEILVKTVEMYVECVNKVITNFDEIVVSSGIDFANKEPVIPPAMDGYNTTKKTKIIKTPFESLSDTQVKDLIRKFVEEMIDQTDTTPSEKRKLFKDFIDDKYSYKRISDIWNKIKCVYTDIKKSIKFYA